jgi:hypothetical protein
LRTVPEEVGFHFPEPEAEAKSVEYSLRAEVERRYTRPRTPKTIGNLANLYFLQHEVVNRPAEQEEEAPEEVTLFTRIGYHITKEPGVPFDWRRNIIQGIHGAYERKRQVEGVNALLSGQVQPNFSAVTLRALGKEIEDKVYGRSIVHEAEAAAIITFCRELM